MLETYLKFSAPVLDNNDNPTQILGWDIVFAGQRVDILAEHSITGKIILEEPMNYNQPITRDMLMVYVDAHISEHNWKRQILTKLA